MTMQRFEFSSIIPAPQQALWDWHLRPGAFQRLTPPWDRVTPIRYTGVREDAPFAMSIQRGPIAIEWRGEHYGIDPPREFRDRMTSGPMRHWDHRHRFESVDAAQTRMIEEIEYALPLGVLGATFGGAMVRSDFGRMFRYRHRVLAADLPAHAEYALPPMRILLSGASGLIGTALRHFLTTGGHEVVQLLRAPRAPRPGEIAWDPSRGFDGAGLAALEGFDAVIHLGGAGIADERWTEDRKRLLRESRVPVTAHLARALASLERKPRVFVSASATGFYPDAGDAIADENSAAGDSFVCALARDWEAAAAPAADAGIRVVHPRFGLVLSPAGGALARMLPFFRACAGGRIGSGRQWMSGIAIDDVLYATLHVLATESLHGAVNFTMPEAARNSDFTSTLAAALGRIVGPPVPAFGLKALYGSELVESLLLASQRVSPKRLLESGYRFRYATFADSFAHILG